MKIEELKGKKIMILGYGQEGVATEQYLKKFLPDVHIEIRDKSMGEGYLEKQSDYDIVIKTPGIPKEHVTIPYTTATNLFFANKGKNLVIGVTGSKGKSTTASLIYDILKKAGKDVRLIGNIGKPALEVLMESSDYNRIYIYELSSYQLDDIKYSPHISVITTLFPEHMNYHGSTELYFAAKKHILDFVTPEDFFIFNPQNKLLATWADETKAQAVPFEKDFIPTESALKGEHNKDNIQAAITVARILKIEDSVSESAVRDFKPLPHRLQPVGTYNSITFYDDAISTSPESTIAALRAIANVKTILLGGENRGYSYRDLAKELQAKNVENVVLFPDSGAAILQEIKIHMHTLPRILQTATMEEAVRFAYSNTPPGGVCLLSTASPSYSLWKNFEQKGDQFQLFVRSLAHGEKTSENSQ